jgi:hypothetical protein
MANTGQMLLVLGALVLFSLMLPSMNRTILYNDRTLLSTNAELTGMSLAQKILDEAGTKAFDVVCITSHPTNPSQLTSPGSLGPAGGETYPNFNDLDDFHGVTILDSVTLPSVLFIITGQVTYADPNDPTQDVTYETFLKRLRVTVTGPYLVNPASGDSTQIALEQIFAYY